MTMAAVIGAWRHMLGIRTTYDESRTVAARASGSFHSLDLPTIRKSKPTAQPTSTFAMRHLNIRAASLTSGSDAAIIEAIAQIGLVSTIFSSVYQRIVEAIKTLMANRIPTESRWIAPNQSLSIERLVAPGRGVW